MFLFVAAAASASAGVLPHTVTSTVIFSATAVAMAAAALHAYWAFNDRWASTSPSPLCMPMKLKVGGHARIWNPVRDGRHSTFDIELIAREKAPPR